MTFKIYLMIIKHRLTTKNNKFGTIYSNKTVYAPHASILSSKALGCNTIILAHFIYIFNMTSKLKANKLTNMLAHRQAQAA